MKDRKQYPSRRAEALRAYRIRRRADPSKLRCDCSFPAVGFASGGDPVCARCKELQNRRDCEELSAEMKRKFLVQMAA